MKNNVYVQQAWIFVYLEYLVILNLLQIKIIGYVLVNWANIEKMLRFFFLNCSYSKVHAIMA